MSTTAKQYLKQKIVDGKIQTHVVWAIEQATQINIYNIMAANKPKTSATPKAPKRNRLTRSVSPNLKQVSQIAPQPRINLQNTEVRKAHMEAEEAKRAEQTEKAKQRRQEQLERQRKQREKLKKMEEKMSRMSDSEARRLKAKLDTRNEAYQQKLNEQIERGEKRKIDLEARFNHSIQQTRKINSERPPLYRIIEDNYSQKNVLPELEKRKALLAKKREMFSPLNHDEMQEYMRQHKDVYDEMEARRKQEWKQKHLEHKMNYMAAQNLKSSFTDAIKTMQKEEEINRYRASQETRALVEKRGRYSEIVKEMYVPTIDKAKAMEIQMVKERAKNPPKLLKPRTHNVNRSVDMGQLRSVSEASSPNMTMRAKFQANTMIPLPKPKLKPKKVDYLGDRRKERQQSGQAELSSIKATPIDVQSVVRNNSLPTSDKLDVIKRQTKKVEQQALKHELLISELPLDNLSGIEAAEEVNTMLISSIKAKLAVLEDSET